MKKCLCTVVCMSILIMLFFNIGYAIGSENLLSEVMPLKAGDLDSAQLLTAELGPSDLPEAVPEAFIEAKGHVNRLYEQETRLDTVMFQNSDGSKTAYVYDCPVKYVDENGDVRDKSNALTSIPGQYRYINAANDISAIYPAFLSAEVGVLLDSGELILECCPDIAPQASFPVGKTYYIKDGSVCEAVLYDGVFGTDTALRYTCTFNGYKEDIILKAPVSESSYRFIVETDGNAMINTGAACAVIDPQTQQVLASFGNLYVYDSSAVRNTVMGTVYCDTIVENEKYSVTMTVPSEFFTQDTVYPVYVDPSVSVSLPGYQNIAASTIVENVAVPVEEPYYVGNYALQYPNGVESFGNTKTLLSVKSAALEPLGISGNQISSAQILLYDIGQETSELDIGVYNVTEGWIVSLAGYFTQELWNAKAEPEPIACVKVGNGGGTLSDGTGTGHWYAFEATRTVRNSVDRTGSYGIMLEACSSDVAGKTFASCNSENVPVVMIDYTEYPINGVCMPINIGYNSTFGYCEYDTMSDPVLDLTGLIGPYGGKALWDFQHVGNNFYTIRNYNNSLYVSLDATYAGVEPIAVLRARDTADDSQLWTLRKTESGNYVIINKTNADNNQLTKVLTVKFCYASGFPIFGETFVISDYSASNTKCEWDIRMPKKTFNFDLYADNAFFNRTLRYYDEVTGKEEDEPSNLNRLYSIIIAVEEFYETRFDVVLDFSEIQIGTTCADLCSKGIDEHCFTTLENGQIVNCQGDVVPCTGDLSTEFHHKNISKMLDSINVTTNNYLLFYTGHPACLSSGANHSYEVQGLCRGKSAIVTEGRGLSGGVREKKMCVTVHEVGHLFGVPDHYSVQYNDERDNCIWGHGKSNSDVEANLTVCSECRERIARGLLFAGFSDFA